MLILNEIYETTKKRYHLKLLCGSKGLTQAMSWVYVTEDMQNADFLKGGELVITTGMNSQHNKNWLYHFIFQILQYQPCGIILNTGKYITEQDISQEVIALCESHDFPLFLMPWDIHISDITHDYYDRIFFDNLDENTITEHFLNIIKNKNAIRHSLDVLHEKGFLISHHYCICMIKCPATKNSISDMLHRLLFLFENSTIANTSNFHIANYENNILLILDEPDSSLIRESVIDILHKLHSFFTNNSFYAGISPITKNLESIGQAAEKASVALSSALFQKKELMCFSDLAFTGLLSLIKDQDEMKQFENLYLGSVIAYDAKHKTDYLLTIRTYIECNGSIQEIAEKLFCHRNTINNRIRSIKNLFLFDIADIHTRYLLMTAFYIRDYFMMIESSFT